MLNPYLINNLVIEEYIDLASGVGSIDDKSNLKDSKVFIFGGSLDTVVN